MISIRKPQSNYNQEGNQSIRQGGGFKGQKVPGGGAGMLYGGGRLQPSL